MLFIFFLAGLLYLVYRDGPNGSTAVQLVMRATISASLFVIIVEALFLMWGTHNKESLTPSQPTKRAVILSSGTVLPELRPVDGL